MFRVSPPWSAWQQRHLSYLAEFTSFVVHVPGVNKVVTDALSRSSPIPVYKLNYSLFSGVFDPA